MVHVCVERYLVNYHVVIVYGNSLYRKIKYIISMPGCIHLTNHYDTLNQGRSKIIFH